MKKGDFFKNLKIIIII